MKYRTQFTGIDYSSPEVNTLPSETVPDQSLTVREILTRFVREPFSPIDFDMSEDDYMYEGHDPEMIDLTDADEVLRSSSSSFSYSSAQIPFPQEDENNESQAQEREDLQSASD